MSQNCFPFLEPGLNMWIILILPSHRENPQKFRKERKERYYRAKTHFFLTPLAVTSRSTKTLPFLLTDHLIWRVEVS